MQNAKTAKKKAQTSAKAEPKKATAKEKAEAQAKVKAIFEQTAENRIKRAKQFSLIASRFETLNEKKDELDNFILSSDGTNETIYLENAKGSKFMVSNSQVIEKVIELLTDQLEIFIDQTEKQIKDFTI